MKYTAKNILFVEANLDGTVGGSHHCLLEIVKNLDKNSYSPSIMFYTNNSLLSEYEQYGKVYIYQIKKGVNLVNNFKSKVAIKAIGIIQKAINFFTYFLYDVAKLSVFLLRNKIDLVHLNNGPKQIEILVACKLLGIKIVAHIRGTFRGDRPYMEKLLVPYFDALIPISRTVENFNREQAISLPKMYLIFDGIDTVSVFNQRKKFNDEVKIEFEVKSDQPFIGLINNIKDWKGQHVVIKAVDLLKNKYPDILCLLVGNVSEADMKYYASLKQLVDECELTKNIVFTGYRADAVDIICSLDAVLHASLGNEGFPRVILETMALGKPIIASSIGPNSEIIHDSVDGLLYEADDHHELAHKINYLLSNPEIRKEIGGNASKKIREHMQILNNVHKIEALYQDLF